MRKKALYQPHIPMCSGQPLDTTPGRVYSGYAEERPSPAEYSDMLRTGPSIRRRGASTRGMRKKGPHQPNIPICSGQAPRYDAGARLLGVCGSKALYQPYIPICSGQAPRCDAGARLLGVYRSKALYQPYVPICSGQALRYDAGGVYSGYAEGTHISQISRVGAS